jgi:putative DNA-invertase from lambdoid prophage Rac
LPQAAYSPTAPRTWLTGFCSGFGRIRDAKRHLTAQGVFSGGSRPFGYDKVPDGDIVPLVPNPTEMAVMARMQALRKDGATYCAIGAVTGYGPRSVMRIL